MRNEVNSARNQVVPAAAAVLSDRERAETAAQQTNEDAQAVADALAAIAGGPVLSVNGKPGPTPVLAATDIAPLSTAAEMQAGAQAAPRSLSPELIKNAILFHAPQSVNRVTRTSNTQITAADNGNWIDITSGTFTQTFAAADALGSGWWCYVGNSGSGDITVPSSDGYANWILYSGEIRIFTCDGTTLRTITVQPRHANKIVLTASGTWTKRNGLKYLNVIVTGRGGYSAGGTAIKKINAKSLAATESVTVNQTDGGTASFGSHCSATGANSSARGTASGGDINLPGGEYTSAPSGLNPGSSFWGGGSLNSGIRAPYGAGCYSGVSDMAATVGLAVVVIEEIY